jgi:hypothetical protein
MPDWRIEGYSVRVERTSFGAGLRRRISAGVLTFGDGLQLGESRNVLGLLTINFLGDAELPTSLGLRYTDSVGRPGLRLDMPLSEFEAVYHILQTERPAWVDFTVSEEVVLGRELDRFSIHSHNERVGEGLADENA